MANENGPPKGSIAYEHEPRGASAPRADVRDDRHGRSDRPDRRRNGNGSHHGERRRNGHTRKSKARDLVRRPTVLIGGAIGVAIIVVAGVLWWLHARNFESTDDAFIDTHIIHVSPQIAGRVVRVYVDDNQRVKTGDPLVDIDAAEPQARLDEARAQARHAQAQLGLAQAQARVARASHGQAVATEAGVAAQSDNAARDIAEQQYRHGVVPFLNVLTSETTLLGTEDEVAQSREALAGDIVALYKALGGGWKPQDERISTAPPPPADEVAR